MRLPMNSEHEDHSQPLSAGIGLHQNLTEEQFTTTLAEVPITEQPEEPIDSELQEDFLSLLTTHLELQHGSSSDGATSMSNGTSTTGGNSRSLLDSVVASPVQTYEQLMASFTYLTAGDVLQLSRGQSETTSASCQAVAGEVNQTYQLSLLSSMIASPVVEHQTTRFDERVSNAAIEEPLEELILKDVETESCPFGVGHQLQVDNYLVNDDDRAQVDCTASITWSFNDELAFIPPYNISDASFMIKDDGEATGELDSQQTQSTVSVTQCDNETSSQCVPSAAEDPVSSETTLDVVEPFSLDPDFDYDNVELSVKFSAEDVEYLMGAAASVCARTEAQSE